MCKYVDILDNVKQYKTITAKSYLDTSTFCFKRKKCYDFDLF